MTFYLTRVLWYVIMSVSVGHPLYRVIVIGSCRRSGFEGGSGKRDAPLPTGISQGRMESDGETICGGIAMVWDGHRVERGVPGD